MIRFRKADPLPKPKFEPPFPVHIYVIAVDVNGNEVTRFDTGMSLLNIDQSVHLEADLRLEFTQPGASHAD